MWQTQWCAMLGTAYGWYQVHSGQDGGKGMGNRLRQRDVPRTTFQKAAHVDCPLPDNLNAVLVSTPAPACQADGDTPCAAAARPGCGSQPRSS